eukprot:gene15813-18753_t
MAIAKPRIGCSLGLGTCDDGWTLSEGACFRYYTSPATFSNAEAACQSAHSGAHLATITSATQNAVAAGLASGPSTYIGINCQSGVKAWTSGTAVDYEQTYHNDPCTNNDCVRLMASSHGWKPGEWDDWSCTQSNRYLCSYESGCASGWAEIEGRCFRYFNQQRSFPGAEAACRELHLDGHLAIITSAEQNTAVHALIPGRQRAWIGLWSGSEASCSTDTSTWEWTSTGEAAGYSNWIDKPWNPPDCHMGDDVGHAVILNCDYDPEEDTCSETSYWEATDVSDKRRYICSYDP